MKALVIYHTKLGNTEQIARAIAASMAECVPTEVISVDEFRPSSLAGVDLLVVGGPTLGHMATPELKAMLNGLGHGSLKGVRAATFDTRIHWPKLLSGSAADDAAKRLKDAGGLLVAPPESFFIVTSEGHTSLAPGEMARASEWGHWLAETAIPAVASH